MKRPAIRLLVRLVVSSAWLVDDKARFHYRPGRRLLVKIESKMQHHVWVVFRAGLDDHQPLLLRECLHMRRNRDPPALGAGRYKYGRELFVQRGVNTYVQSLDYRMM